jgi:hypothetical protein
MPMKVEIRVQCWPGAAETEDATILLEHSPGESLIFSYGNAALLHEHLGAALEVVHQARTQLAS